MFVIIAVPHAESAGPLFLWVAIVSALLQVGGLMWCLSIQQRLRRMNGYPPGSLSDEDQLIPEVPAS